MFTDSEPIFIQLAGLLAGKVLDGTYEEGAQVPSINELAIFFRINPATANRAVASLVEDGILEKRRGIGMFVRVGAKEQISMRRRKDLTKKYIQPLIAEARALGLSSAELLELVRKESG